MKIRSSFNFIANHIAARIYTKSPIWARVIYNIIHVLLALLIGLPYILFICVLAIPVASSCAFIDMIRIYISIIYDEFHCAIGRTVKVVYSNIRQNKEFDNHMEDVINYINRKKD